MSTSTPPQAPPPNPSTSSKSAEQQQQEQPSANPPTTAMKQRSKRKCEMWISNNKVLIGGGKKPHARNPNFETEETKLLISLWGDPKVTHINHDLIETKNRRLKFNCFFYFCLTLQREKKQTMRLTCVCCVFECGRKCEVCVGSGN